jgi:hypothetical protein
MSRCLIMPSQLFDVCNHLTTEETGKLLQRAILYVENEYEENEDTEKGALSMAWSLWKVQIREHGKKYDAVCQQRKQAAEARWAQDKSQPFPRRRIKTLHAMRESAEA